jgi:starch phosphorylase
LLKEVIDSIRSDLFCPSEPGIFDAIAKSLLENGDPYLMLADFQSYLEASRRADELYSQPREWPVKPSSTSPEAASSLPTEPYVNTLKISGRSDAATRPALMRWPFTELEKHR